MTHLIASRLTVFYDGGCAVCSREIGFYQRLRGADQFYWVDVAHCEPAALGADRIEIYTGPFAEAFAAGDAASELALCADTARRARVAGLGVNAGHDLSQANLGAFLAQVSGVLEVSIGHALIGEALYDGLDATVRAYLAIAAGADPA